MSIPQQRYVSITSVVAGSDAVEDRELILRIFTTNELVPTNTNIEFSQLSDVGDYFGTSSEEYSRASFYFSFVSKTGITPNSLSFFRWADSATAPQIFGAEGTYAVSDFTGVTDGTFTLTLGAITEDITGLDFSSAVSLADVATVIQTAVQAANVDASFASATVVYNVSRQSFDLEGGATGAYAISVAATGSGTNVLPLVGWDSSSAIFSNGVAVQSITDVLDSSLEQSNNFGSYLFMPTLTLAQVTESAQWNLSPSGENVQFFYTAPVTAANASAWSAALSGYRGTCLTLAGPSGEYHEMIPSVVLAATDYTKINSSKNYMYQVVSGLTPTVYTNANADLYDGLKINYYGQTQSNGLLEFYQRGVIFGGTTDPATLEVYANEVYLKRTISTAILNAFLTSERIPANQAGAGRVRALILDVCADAVQSGIISTNKTLTTAQKAAIIGLTNDEFAVGQVETLGYYLTVTPFASSNKITYTLIYSKDDVVRQVVGTDVLI